MNGIAGSSDVGFGIEALVSLLLIVSGLLVLSGAVGLLRLKDFFQRMHPVALGTTLGAWTACTASVAYFSALHGEAVVHAWLIPMALAVTVPITTLLLARAALFRRRAAGGDVPPPLAQESPEQARGLDGATTRDQAGR
jgi:multicomponent K+:H+ antiporter subunit G